MRIDTMMQSHLRILVTQMKSLKLYNRTHPDENLEVNEPIFPDYYRPSNDQKIGEILYVGGGMLSLGYLASKWL